MKEYFIKLFLRYFGIDDVLEHITDKEYLRGSDIIQLLSYIDDHYDTEMHHFLTEKFGE